MGRKIPGKKHRGVKDPLEQIARRDESLKLKLNAPPLNPNAQEVPKKVLEIGRLIAMVKEGKYDRKKKQKKIKTGLIEMNTIFDGSGPRLPGMTRPVNKHPSLIQRPGESEQSFLDRVNDATEDIINAAKFEEEHSIDAVTKKVVEDDDNLSGLDDVLLKAQKPVRRKAQAKKTSEDGKVKISKSLNRRQRLKLKKAALKDVDEFTDFSDHVKFGEVVHHPPHLTARPKGVTNTKFAKPGLKNLLLTNMMTNSKTKVLPKPKLSVVAQRNLEAQREAAVAAYRAIKAKRMAQNRS